MMKELFGLQRFDLSQQTGHLIGLVKEEKTRLDTKLEALESVNKTLISEKKEEQIQKIKELEVLSKACEEQEKQIRQQEKLKEKKESLNKFTSELNTLQQEKPEIDRKKEYHSRFLTAKNKLRPTWELLKTLKIEIEKNKVSLDECTRWAKDYVGEIDGLQSNLKQLEKLNQERPIRESKIRDLKQVLDIQVYRSKKSGFQQEIGRLAPEIAQKKENLKSLQTKIRELEQGQNTQNLPNASTLANWKSWTQEWGRNLAEFQKVESASQGLKEASSHLEKQLAAIEKSIPKGVVSLMDWEKEENIQLEQLSNQSQKLKDQSGLALHAHHLHDGQACPLCGSLDHPDPISEEARIHELQEIEEKISEAKLRLTQIRELQKKHGQLDYEKKQNLKNTEIRVVEQKNLQEQKNRLTEQIKAAGFMGTEDLQERMDEAEKAIAANETRQKEISQLRQNLENLQALAEQLDVHYSTTQKQFDQLETAEKTKLSEIRDTEFTKRFFDQSKEEIEDSIAKVEKSIIETQQNLEGARRHLQGRKDMQSQNSASLKMYQRTLTEATEKEQELASKYAKDKVNLGFMDEQELKMLFEDSIDEEKVALQIRKFEDRLYLVQNRVDELQRDEDLMAFDLDIFHAMQETLFEKTQELEAKKSELTLLGQTVQTLEKELQSKIELQDDLEKVVNRLSNLRELDVLFRGGGFVKFVSSIYLRELCNTANIRFMKLTKNQLSLDIDDNNTFWVLDYLNGGKRRLLKTLSGGQTFQASLCLALALAEKIKALNQADQSFFFMDEGFGALDKSSLGVVFDTLKSLQFENRIVGIISHVEELQQEIGVYAKVELDPENGSQVSYSFA